MNAKSAGKLNFWRDVTPVQPQAVKCKSNLLFKLFQFMFLCLRVCVLAPVWMGPKASRRACVRGWRWTFVIIFAVQICTGTNDSMNLSSHIWFWCALVSLSWRCSCCVCVEWSTHRRRNKHSKHYLYTFFFRLYFSSRFTSTPCTQASRQSVNNSRNENNNYKKTLSNLLNAKTAFRATELFSQFFFMEFHSFYDCSLCAQFPNE